MKNGAEKPVNATATTFSKEQILQAKRFRRYVDALPFLLEDGREYTLDEVERVLNDWMKGQVK